MSGRNTCISSVGGTGKTAIIREMEMLCTAADKRVACVNPTGITAVNLGDEINACSMNSFLKCRRLAS